MRTGCLRYTPMRAEPVQVAGTISARRWPDIWRFVSSPVVQVGQYLLNHNGYTVNTDGAFTAATIATVAGFQSEARSCGRPDATFTDATWEALVPELDKTCSSCTVWSRTARST